MIRSLFAFALCFCVQPLLANQSVKPLKERIEFKRNSDGTLYEVTIRHNLPSRPLDLVTGELISAFEDEQDFGLMYNPVPATNKRLPGESEVGEFRSVARKIIKVLGGINIEDEVKKASLREVLERFQRQLAEAMRDFQVIARPSEPAYFHSNNVLKELLKFGLKDAKDSLSGPVLGIASYIISETVRMLADRRAYYQNFMAHYFMTHSPEQLGLSEREVAHIKSSIYESKIAWDKPWDSREIEEQWDTFGTEKYQELVNEANANWAREKHRFDSHSERYNFAFVPVQQNGVFKIMNAADESSRYSNRLSESFRADRPCRQIFYRFGLRLIEFGTHQISLPGFIKRRFRRYISSLHAPQSIREGYLTAHLLAEERQEVGYILLQGFNLFVITENERDSQGNSRYENLSCR
ncbi:MAG: hypothetical protein HRT45_16410 [Bdellovibrionales bacterium]|nr:hypothetical protein [Bdellovibrionales bacterium]